MVWISILLLCQEVENNFYLVSFQKIRPSKDVHLCGVYPGTMENKGGHIGGLNCKKGFIIGSVVVVQNSIVEAYLSLYEVVVYGLDEF